VRLEKNEGATLEDGILRVSVGKNETPLVSNEK
jgi:hypothetical protein